MGELRKLLSTRIIRERVKLTRKVANCSAKRKYERGSTFMCIGNTFQTILWFSKIGLDNVFMYIVSE